MVDNKGTEDDIELGDVVFVHQIFQLFVEILALQVQHFVHDVWRAKTLTSGIQTTLRAVHAQNDGVGDIGKAVLGYVAIGATCIQNVDFAFVKSLQTVLNCGHIGIASFARLDFESARLTTVLGGVLRGGFAGS